MPEDANTSDYELAPETPVTPIAPVTPVEPPVRLWAPSPPEVKATDLTTDGASRFGLARLFMALAGGLVIGTILQHQTPVYCPNDASRWNTVYYLVEHGTYEYLPEHGAWWNTKQPKGVEDFQVGLPFWTIDMVAFEDDAGGYHFHSSKPPLLSTMVAGVVLGIEKVTGAVDWLARDSSDQLRPFIHDFAPGLKTLRADFRMHPWFIIRTALIIVQGIPFLLFIWVFSKLFRQMLEVPQALVFCMAAAALGTYLTAYSVTLNNHVLAAFAATFAAYPTIQIWYEERREWYWFALAGFFATLAAAMEMPAAALTAAVLVALAWKDWRRTLQIAVPLALIPVAAFLVTNYLEFGSIKPVQMRFDEPKGPYHYPGSYWNEPTGMDALHEPNHIYLMHMLVGHHGMFLLMPVLLAGLIGLGRHLRSVGLGVAALVSVLLAAAVALMLAGIPRWGVLAESLPVRCTLLAPIALLLLVNLGMYLPEPKRSRPLLALVILLSSAVVSGFYLTRSQHNYGGGAQGFRWMFWLLPLWLLMLPAGVEWMLRRRAGRCLLGGLLFVSVMSVGFALRFPWAMSWGHILFQRLGWINY